ncbi:MAG TPA: hypothetical protein VIM70_10705 [Clostridium sp.]|uniref:hypothetical protein n=1 Tax=Clostridium sp. TaxID=1506 RepID=UPI002F956474
MNDINEILGVNEKSEDAVEVNNNENIIVISENKIGSTLKTIGKATLILGILIGLIVGLSLTTPDPEYSILTEPNPLRWTYGIAIMVSSFVSGVTFLGFGEVIVLLDKIKNNTSK